jgi:hypothetical protein
MQCRSHVLYFASTSIWRICSSCARDTVLFTRTTIMSGQFDFSSSPTLSSSQLISSLSLAQNLNSNLAAISNNSNQFFSCASGPSSFSRNGCGDFSAPAQNLGSYDINFRGDHNPHAPAMSSVKRFLKPCFCNLMTPAMT